VTPAYRRPPSWLFLGHSLRRLARDVIEPQAVLARTQTVMSVTKADARNSKPRALAANLTQPTTGYFSPGL
jgi:hypothetical protein